MKEIIRKIIPLLVCLSLCYVSDAQFRDSAVYEELYDSETVVSMKKHVGYMSAAHLEGRKAGSEGELLTAQYVKDAFKEYGVEILTPVTGEEFGIRTNAGDTLTSRNVIGYIEGYDRKLKDRFIVVGARMDNLGSMTMTVDGKPVEKIFYGANGNASGVSVLIELARMIKTNSVLFRRSVLLVAFGASQETSAGAWYFLNRAFSGKDKIDAMVNLDMLGTGYNGFYAYTVSNVDLNAMISRLSAELHPVQPEVVATEPYPSDHRAFYAAEIPSVTFTTGRYPEWNTEKDTQSVIDFDMMERELEYIYNFTLTLANTDAAPAFHTVASPSRGPSFDDVMSYGECDIPPMFLNSTDPGKFLKEWVYQYIKYPQESLREGIQGRVVVDFIIEKDGRLSNVRVVKGVSEDIDAEAVKVISASPKWRPGRVDGNKVRTAMSVSVEFRLEKKGAKPSFGIKK